MVRRPGRRRCALRARARDRANACGARPGGVVLLQRLVEYADLSEDVIPAFYAYKAVRWSLEIDGNGVPRGDLVSMADRDDPQRRFGVARLVPAVTRTVGISPALAVDNGEY